MTQDHAGAARWYRRAAEQKAEGPNRLPVVVARFRLGRLYHNGEGVRQDYAEAVKWWRRAAEAGDSKAKFGLGTMYAMGKGVPRDHVLASMWFELVSDAAIVGGSLRLDGLPEAWALHDATRLRDDIAFDLTPDQIAKAQRLAREWLLAH